MYLETFRLLVRQKNLSAFEPITVLTHTYQANRHLKIYAYNTCLIARSLRFGLYKSKTHSTGRGSL